VAVRRRLASIFPSPVEASALLLGSALGAAVEQGAQHLLHVLRRGDLREGHADGQRSNMQLSAVHLVQKLEYAGALEIDEPFTKPLVRVVAPP
jgi:hypothetical protein